MAIEKIFPAERFSLFDRYFGEFISRISGSDSYEIISAAVLLSYYASRGNTCIDIREIAGKDIYELIDHNDEEERVMLPVAEKWISSLLDNSAVGRQGDYKPLILDDKCRLYLHRFSEFEGSLAEDINSRIARPFDKTDLTGLKDVIGRIFGDNKSKKINWQKISAYVSLTGRISIITGGPGTGKTSTIVRILALIIELSDRKDFNIALAAPTGKAAGRLGESVRKIKTEIDISSKTINNIPDETFTIHRLLGPASGSNDFRHNRDNKLPHDIIVVDESSMVDLALMSNLLGALKPDSRLILVGDRDQLSSIEAGSVFADICDSGNIHGYSGKFIRDIHDYTGESIPSSKMNDDEPDIADSLVHFERSFRFGTESGIGEFSTAVREGDSSRAVKILKSDKYSDINIRDVDNRSIQTALEERLIEGYSGYLNASAPEQVIDRLSDFTILCAVRKGPRGVDRINEAAEEVLRIHGNINTAKKWYNRRPLMVTVNDYSHNLFNGDIGVVFAETEADHEADVLFNSDDGGIRKINPLSLPEHETVYAMTVHKSQGSEFKSVLIIIPDIESSFLTRELLYTAITRARKNVEIWGSLSVVEGMIGRQVSRKSGLVDKLWNI